MRSFQSVVVIWISLLSSMPSFAESSRWSEQAANAWYHEQPWIVGEQFHSCQRDQRT